MPRPCALIAGASGVVGRAVLRTLAERGDWDVVALSRSATSVSNTRAIAVDLSSADDVRDRLSPLAGITHLVYCARATHSMAKRESVDDNVDMLRNLLDALERSSPRLAHVHIVQGSKVYGSDLGPYRTPARESDPRVTPSNWYYAQEDLLVARSIANMIGVYAAVLKELGQPLAFPGTQSGFDALYQSVDADLLARAIAFIVTTPACANRVFNVTNGDYVRWRNLWPAFATFFGMDTGPVQEGTTLAGFMQGKDAIWDAVVARHGLLPRPLSQAGVWSYADFNFRRGYDVMSSTIALRQAGFAECLDTERMFLDHLQRFREQRVLP